MKTVMIGRRGLAWGTPCLLLLAACDAESPADETVTAELPPPDASLRAREFALPPANAAQPPVNAAQPGANAAAEEPEQAPKPAQPLGNSRYTSLEPGSCEPIEDIAEGAAAPRRCAGPSGYAIEAGQSDLAIVTPGGERSTVDLASLAKGASVSLGKTAEWRAPAPGKPRALIVRVNVGEGAEARYPRNSNLVVVRLDAEPCVVAVVPRGPAQNEKARAIADGKLPECRDD